MMRQPTLFLTVGLPCTGKMLYFELTRELDGTEPIDDPPAGFATWDAWRKDRWPPSIS